MVCTIFISIDISHCTFTLRSLTYLRFANRTQDIAASILNLRQCRCFQFACTWDGRACIIWHCEVFRCYRVGICPYIRLSVYRIIVCINIRSATVCRFIFRTVCLFCQNNRLSANCDGRQGRCSCFADAIHRWCSIGRSWKRICLNRVNKLPWVRLTRTIGIKIIISYRAIAIDAYILYAVSVLNGCHCSSAIVCQFLNLRCLNIA